MNNQYIYAICNKKTGDIINRKCKGNPFYVNKKSAENKMYSDTEEVITYELRKVIK